MSKTFDITHFGGISVIDNSPQPNNPDETIVSFDDDGDIAYWSIPISYTDDEIRTMYRMAFEIDKYHVMTIIGAYPNYQVSRNTAELFDASRERGRPVGSGEGRNVTFRLMLTPDERQKLNDLAEAQGQTPSQYVRDRVFGCWHSALL